MTDDTTPDPTARKALADLEKMIRHLPADQWGYGQTQDAALALIADLTAGWRPPTPEPTDLREKIARALYGRTGHEWDTADYEVKRYWYGMANAVLAVLPTLVEAAPDATGKVDWNAFERDE